MEKGAKKIAEVSKIKMGKTESFWAFPILDQEGLLRSLKRKWPVEQKKTIMRRQVSIRSPLSAKSKMKNPLIRSVYELEEQDKSNSNVSNEEENNNYTTLPRGNVFDTKKRKGGASALEQAFNNEAREQLNFEIARMYPSPCFLDGKYGCVEPCVASGTKSRLLPNRFCPGIKGNIFGLLMLEGKRILLALRESLLMLEGKMILLVISGFYIHLEHSKSA